MPDAPLTASVDADEAFPDVAAAGRALARIREIGGRRLVADMLALYLPAAERSLAEARAALAAGDAAELARAVHALKSGSGQLGALALLAACEDAERLGKRGALAEAPEALAVVARRLAAFVAWLREEGHDAAVGGADA